MINENPKSEDPGESRCPETEKKPYVDPISKLTPEQWDRAMSRGQMDAKAQSASIRRDMIQYYWRTRLPELREELNKAETALRAYFERPSSEPPDTPLHQRLAENLKRATDDLKNDTDKYVWLVSD